MSYRVITTAKHPGKGSVSRSHTFAENPSAEDLRILKNEARDEYLKVNGASLHPVIDLSIRRES